MLTVDSARPEQMRKEMQFWMKEFDKDVSGTITFAEFLAGVRKCFAVDNENANAARRQEAQREVTSESEGEGDEGGPYAGEAPAGDEEQGVSQVLLPEGSSEEQQQRSSEKRITHKHGPEHREEDEESEDKETEKQPLPSRSKTTAIAVSMLLLGALVCTIVADPFVDAVSAFSKASGVPSFFIAFVVAPLASNASELVSSLQFAKRKRMKNITLTFGQVYGAVTMNNTMCLGLFLLVVYHQSLPWKYTGEVLVILVVVLLVGVLGALRVTLQSMWAVLVILLYPLSLVAVYVCNYVLRLDTA
jgi:Ca2+/Na+ antiporter